MRKGRGIDANELRKRNMRLREIVHKNRGGFAHSCDSIFLYLGIRRKNPFGEALDHGPGEGEVLWLSVSAREYEFR